MGPLVGCLNVTENENIDVTVSNASETPIEYDVSVEGFTETGSIEVDGSDQYEDKLSPPGSSSQFEVAASFALALDDSSAGQQNDTGTNQPADNESQRGDAEPDRFETTVDVNSDVTEVSVTYTGGRMIVNPVIPTND